MKTTRRPALSAIQPHASNDRGAIVSTATAPHQWMRRANGERAVSFRRNGFEVLVTPSNESENDAALSLAQALSREMALAADAEDRAERLSEANAKLRARVEQLEAAAEAAVVGRRRFFGPVLAVPEVAGDWAGAVLLLDPEKRHRGYSLRFGSMRVLHREHPELWVVGHVSDGVLLDATPAAPAGAT